MLPSRSTRTLLALVSASFLAAGCAGGGDGAASIGQSEPDGGGDPTAAARSVDVEHAMGTTAVTCTPERVVTLGQGQTDSVLGLGVTPVGVVSAWSDGWYDYLPAEVEEATVVGTELEPDLEAIAALQPDLILGSVKRHEALYDQLSQIAPTVMSETIGVTWRENVGLWGEAMCRPDAAEEALAAYEERTTELRAALGERTTTEVSMVRFMPDQVRIYLTGFPGSVLRDVGLSRPEPQQVDDWETSEQLIEISEERIPEMDGDVIFVMVSNDWYGLRDGTTVDATMEHWTSSDLWKGLDAVQAGAVHEVNEDHWNLGGGLLAAHRMLDDLEAYFLDEEA